MKVETPELDKMLKVKNESQAIGEFIESLREKGLYICREVDKEYGLTTVDDNGDDYSTYVENTTSIEELLADFFGIDLKKCEEERQAILNSLQS